jgi:hypothetical protein
VKHPQSRPFVVSTSPVIARNLPSLVLIYHFDADIGCDPARRHPWHTPCPALHPVSGNEGEGIRQAAVGIFSYAGPAPVSSPSSEKHTAQGSPVRSALLAISSVRVRLGVRVRGRDLGFAFGKGEGQEVGKRDPPRSPCAEQAFAWRGCACGTGQGSCRRGDPRPHNRGARW